MLNVLQKRTKQTQNSSKPREPLMLKLLQYSIYYTNYSNNYSNVIEAYEKAIAELIHDKEQLVQDHEREMLEVQADRDSNYHHLTSLETTFSDLHV